MTVSLPQLPRVSTNIFFILAINHYELAIAFLNAKHIIKLYE